MLCTFWVYHLNRKYPNLPFGAKLKNVVSFELAPQSPAPGCGLCLSSCIHVYDCDIGNMQKHMQCHLPTFKTMVSGHKQVVYIHVNSTGVGKVTWAGQ